MGSSDRPLVLKIMLLLLRIAGLRVHRKSASVQADGHRVVMRARHRDRDRQLIVRLIDVDRRRFHRRLLRHRDLA